LLDALLTLPKAARHRYPPKSQGGGRRNSNPFRAVLPVEEVDAQAEADAAAKRVPLDRIEVDAMA